MKRLPLALALSIALVPDISLAQTAPETPTAPPVAGCDSMDIGPVYDTSLAASATLACFQLVTPSDGSSTKLDVNLAGFRAGETHDVSLARVDPDGTTHAVASDVSTDPSRIVQAMAAPATRWLVLVGRAAAAAATESPFQIQATLATGSDIHEPNDAIANTTVLRGNQHIKANLDNPADTDHYLIVVRADQKQTIVEMDAEPGILAELFDGTNARHALQTGKPIRVDSSRPLFIRVGGTGPVRNGASYALRTRDPHAYAVISRVYSTENISHLAPGLGTSMPGGANAARTINVEATVYEGDGETLVGAGHRIIFSAVDAEYAQPRNRHWPLASIEALTDDRGNAHATLHIGGCKGGLLGPVNVATRDNPPNFWSITYNPTSFVFATLKGNASPPLGSYKGSVFQHICKESFRGHRP